ncbi:peptidoglycan recognition family protein [Kitasatospora purpeofusca]|uniref:peptidoglycan recognition protein family protein n=1 Tax=Kitasatospora purpeofusca TaxID=67352 RepID=UPI00386F2982|nr:peptidoglycan recognition protein family protein [Kitasatospora purpeofusca]
MPNPSSAVSRRTLVTAIGATAAAIATAPAAHAAAPSTPAAPATPAPAAPAAPGTQAARTVTVPATRARSAAGRAAAGVRTDFPIQYVGVSWDGPRRGGAIRLHHEETGPGAWQPIATGCAGGPDVAGTAAKAAPVSAALVPADGAVGYDLRLPDGATNLRSTALDTTTGPARTTTLSPTTPVTFCGVEYLSRAAWGADESKRFKNGVENSPAKYYPLQTLTVHHTDTPNADPDPAATVRAIYEYHAITNDWGDIGYHFLIDEAGRIYEGRWSGDDGIPGFDANGNAVTAFHTAGFNSGNLGVALLGTLVNQQPTAKARQSLALVLSLAARTHGLDPQAHVTFVNPVNGVTKPVDLISGHRDWLATDCPGGVFYGTLPALRAEVAAL